MVLRFAPSPTGYLHVGNARTAVINWLISKQNGESFLLRFDDTDKGRSTSGFVDAIKEDLNWLGISWNRSFAQSERLQVYETALTDLRKKGNIYPCYETDDELDLKRARQRSLGRPPVYDRSALKLTSYERKKLESDGRKPHWRFRLPDESFFWRDSIYGDVRFDVDSYSDPVVARADGRPLYTLTSVVDDVDTETSFIVRGSDHLSNSGAQIALFKSLGASVPIFAHHALLTGPKGEPLSKRLGSLSLRALHDVGIESKALLNYLAFIGSSSAIKLFRDVDKILAEFDVVKLGRTNVAFEEHILKNLSSQYLHELSFDDVRDRFESIGLDSVRPNFWYAVRRNISIFDDVLFWWRIINESIEPLIDDPSFAEVAVNSIPDGEFGDKTWKEWTERLSNFTGRKGKSLFMPLRLALTGCEHGPAMADLLPLLGRAKVEGRLLGKAV